MRLNRLTRQLLLLGLLRRQAARTLVLARRWLGAGGRRGRGLRGMSAYRLLKEHAEQVREWCAAQLQDEGRAV